MLLARLPYRAAYLGYAALLVGLVITGLPPLGRALKLNGWPRGQLLVTMVGVLLFEPFFMSVLKGQDSGLLLLGGLLWLSGMIQKDDRLAGLGLALTFIRPQIALLLGLPFLFKQRKVFFWFLAGAVLLGLVSLLEVGWTGVRDYIHILTLSAGGEGYGMSEATMFNFTGLLLRFAPLLDIGLVHAVGWGLFAAVLIGLCVLWAFSKSIGDGNICLAVVLSLFTAPHLHYHDLALLVVPIVGLGVAGVAAGWVAFSRAAALPMAASVVLVFCEFSNSVRFTIPYFLMAGILVVVWLMEKRRPEIPEKKQITHSQ
jgi:hypothetical protein